MTVTLTPSIQDYLEVILDLSKGGESVRVTDIAKKLEVAKASVTQAINNLKDLGLVRKERYGPISLTENGKREAVKVRYKHMFISMFISEVLKVKESIAERDACLMEHAISKETILALIDLLEKENLIDASLNMKEVKTLLSTNTLNELKPGSKGKIVRVQADGMLKRRILEMGITTGDEVLVKRVAPLGDPIEISIKDYNLSLRKKEAISILVEVI